MILYNLIIKFKCSLKFYTSREEIYKIIIKNFFEVNRYSIIKMICF